MIEIVKKEVEKIYTELPKIKKEVKDIITELPKINL